MNPPLVIYALSSPGEVRAVALLGGAIVDVAIERPGRPDGVGDLLRGRVTAVVPSLAGSFVALPEAEGFLPDSAAAPGLSVGSAVAVRIVRAAQGGKGPRLDARALDPVAPGPPALLARGPGAVARLAALHPGAPILADGAGLAAALRPRVVVQAAPPPDMIEALDALADPVARLDNGVRATFSPTPALVAVDLDTSAATDDRRGKAAAQHALNRDAIPGVARHIRARNLSGAILLDLAGMGVKRRAALGGAIAAALAPDPLGPRFLGFTGLGLAEILRPRGHPPLHELLAGPHAAALAALRRLVREQAARPAVPLALRAAPDVADALAADPVATADLARATGRALMLHRDASLAPSRWSIEEVSRA